MTFQLQNFDFLLEYPIADYHAKYFAWELTKRSASDSLQKLASTIVDAQVDLNPHQVKAALFAFRSPLSMGAALVDVVGLGKTIEACLVISQKWAERKRRILIITPANLRKQWSQELMDKFFLPSVILEAKSFNDAVKAGSLNPFDQQEIVLCSYQFARSKEAWLRQVRWDLAVIDEAHRLKSGFELTPPIANLDFAGKTVYSFADGELLICLNKGFQGADADAVKTNAMQIMKSKGCMNFRTV